MKLNKLVLALSLAVASSAASAAPAAVYVSSPLMQDAIILQTSVSSAVQLGVTVESGSATATLNSSVQPTATIQSTTFGELIPTIAPATTVSSVQPSVGVFGRGTASALVTQDVNAIVVVPVSAINAIAAVVGVGY